MNFKASSLSKFQFSELTGGMPLSDLLNNTSFVGGYKFQPEYIDKQIMKLDNNRFANLVVPAGLYVERGGSGHYTSSEPNPPQYINEQAFEELFGISVKPISQKKQSRRHYSKEIKKKTKKSQLHVKN